MKNKDFQEKFNKDNRLANDYIAQVMNLKVSREQRREDYRFFKCNIECSLCDVVITDARESHNAMPLNDSRCCASCNNEKVILSRISSTVTSK
jgi:hypothetical protein